jgi:hypothetical protein
MTERGFAACLAAVLNGEVHVNESFDPDGVHDAVPYDEVGMLTRNAGLVVRMDDGSQFQITVVRTRGPR